jgi:hypothetical protein
VPCWCHMSTTRAAPQRTQARCYLLSVPLLLAEAKASNEEAPITGLPDQGCEDRCK